MGVYKNSHCSRIHVIYAEESHRMRPFRKVETSQLNLFFTLQNLLRWKPRIRTPSVNKYKTRWQKLQSSGYVAKKQRKSFGQLRHNSTIFFSHLQQKHFHLNTVKQNINHPVIGRYRFDSCSDFMIFLHKSFVLIETYSCGYIPFNSNVVPWTTEMITWSLNSSIFKLSYTPTLILIL